MQLTPLDIQQQQFTVKFRGFSAQEVDAFLDQIADAYEGMLNQNKALQEKVLQLQEQIQSHREREESFKRALLNSQKVIEQVKENARKASDLIIAEAEVQAQRILQRAHNRLAQLHEDMGQLKRQRMQIEVQIRNIIEAHTKMLEVSKEEMKALDEEDHKLKLLK